jgi:hypothetical protein
VSGVSLHNKKTIVSSFDVTTVSSCVGFEEAYIVVGYDITPTPCWLIAKYQNL